MLAQFLLMINNLLQQKQRYLVWRASFFKTQTFSFLARRRVNCLRTLLEKKVIKYFHSIKESQHFWHYHRHCAAKPLTAVSLGKLRQMHTNYLKHLIIFLIARLSHTCGMNSFSIVSNIVHETHFNWVARAWVRYRSKIDLRKIPAAL